jgi:hypothetical protein
LVFKPKERGLDFSVWFIVIDGEIRIHSCASRCSRIFADFALSESMSFKAVGSYPLVALDGGDELEDRF